MSFHALEESRGHIRRFNWKSRAPPCSSAVALFPVVRTVSVRQKVVQSGRCFGGYVIRMVDEEDRPADSSHKYISRDIDIQIHHIEIKLQTN